MPSVMDSLVVSTQSNYEQQQAGSGVGAGWRAEHGTGEHDVLCDSGLTAEATFSVKFSRPGLDMVCTYERVSGKLDDMRGSIRVG